ncbi:hypothetical protein NDU88_004388 [Pleurodeles waltl]|uniref:Uncharacterized protein n=1 Tax=Pleurodeles waltl TaxID=8319 RepID=A0AAV7MWA1_PLEWA|nr:hypothetical protein NDU88_004388 [Pleurodeles waltl]
MCVPNQKSDRRHPPELYNCMFVKKTETGQVQKRKVHHLGVGKRAEQKRAKQSYQCFIKMRGCGLAAKENGRLRTELRAPGQIPASVGATSASGSLLNNLPEAQDTRTGEATGFDSGA